MLGVSKAQISKQTPRTMTSEEINHTPQLEMGKATCQWIKGALGHCNELRPKSFLKNPKRWS
jgi:hypothetical protein